MSADATDNLKRSSGGRVSAWIAAISTIVTLGLTAFNAVTSHNIDKQKMVFEKEKTRLKAIETNIAELEVKSKIALEQARENFTRYEFVHKMLPNVLSKDSKERLFSENLILLTLSEDEAEKLFEGLKGSGEKKAKEAGTSGLNALRTVRKERQSKIYDLAKELDHEQRQVRISAASTLVRIYSEKIETVDAILDLLSEENIGNISASGRINALYVLTETDRSIWNPELLSIAYKSIERIQKRHDNGLALIGPQTEERLKLFKAHLDAIRGLLRKSS